MQPRGFERSPIPAPPAASLLTAPAAGYPPTPPAAAGPCPPPSPPRAPGRMGAPHFPHSPLRTERRLTSDPPSARPGRPRALAEVTDNPPPPTSSALPPVPVTEPVPSPYPRDRSGGTGLPWLRGVKRGGDAPGAADRSEATVP